MASFRGFRRSDGESAAGAGRLAVIVIFGAILVFLSGCILKTGPDAGLVSTEQHRLVMTSIPAGDEGLVSSALTPAILRGWSSLRNGRFAQAEQQFTDLLADGSVLSDQRLAAALSGLGFVRLGQLRHREAADVFGQALEKNSGYGPARLGQALGLRIEGRADECVALYDELSADHPHSVMLKLEAAAVRLEAVQLLIRRGEAANSEGDARAAAVQYRRAIDLDPEMARLFGLLAGVLEPGGRYDEALDALGQAVALADGEEADAFRARLAWLELEHGRPDRAVTWFTTLLQATPGDPVLQDGLARAREKLREELLPAEYRQLLAGSPLDRGGLAAVIALEFDWDEDAAGAAGVRPRVIRDSGSHWAQPYIRAVVNREVMELFQNHTFRPELLVTRGELAFAACRLLGSDGEAAVVQEPVILSDMSRQHRHYDCVCRLVGLKLFRRYPDNTIRINAEATGADALSLVAEVHRRLADLQP